MASIVSDGKNLVGDALALHEMFRIIGDQLTPDDIKALTFIYGGLYHANDFFLQAKDGYSFLLSLERLGRIDESNFKHILELLRILTRQDLVQHLTLRRRKTGMKHYYLVPILSFYQDFIFNLMQCLLLNIQK